jgi:hypothetical protein
MSSLEKTVVQQLALRADEFEAQPSQYRKGGVLKI